MSNEKYQDEFKKVHSVICRAGGYYYEEGKVFVLGRNITYLDCLDIVGHGGGDLYGGDFGPGDIVSIINNKTGKEIKRFEF